jgi:hypothetical protein
MVHQQCEYMVHSVNTWYISVKIRYNNVYIWYISVDT